MPIAAAFGIVARAAAGLADTPAPDMVRTLDALVATDPFAEHGLIENMTVDEWDPIFGVFNAQSSMPGQVPGK